MKDYALKIMSREIGNKRAIEWINNYKFPDSYEDMVRIKSSWNNITQKLDNVIISKKDLYKDLANYYKDRSKIQFIKYKILTLLYNYE